MKATGKTLPVHLSPARRTPSPMGHRRSLPDSNRQRLGLSPATISGPVCLNYRPARLILRCIMAANHCNSGVARSTPIDPASKNHFNPISGHSSVASLNNHKIKNRLQIVVANPCNSGVARSMPIDTAFKNHFSPIPGCSSVASLNNYGIKNQLQIVVANPCNSGVVRSTPHPKIISARFPAAPALPSSIIDNDVHFLGGCETKQ